MADLEGQKVSDKNAYVPEIYRPHVSLSARGSFVKAASPAEEKSPVVGLNRENFQNVQVQALNDVDYAALMPGVNLGGAALQQAETRKKQEQDANLREIIRWSDDLVQKIKDVGERLKNALSKSERLLIELNNKIGQVEISRLNMERNIEKTQEALDEAEDINKRYDENTKKYDQGGREKAIKALGLDPESEQTRALSDEKINELMVQRQKELDNKFRRESDALYQYQQYQQQLVIQRDKHIEVIKLGREEQKKPPINPEDPNAAEQVEAKAKVVENIDVVSSQTEELLYPVLTPVVEVSQNTSVSKNENQKLTQEEFEQQLESLSESDKQAIMANPNRLTRWKNPSDQSEIIMKPDDLRAHMQKMLGVSDEEWQAMYPPQKSEDVKPDVSGAKMEADNQKDLSVESTNGTTRKTMNPSPVSAVP